MYPILGQLALVSESVWPKLLPPDKETSFAAYCRKRFGRQSAILAMVVIAGTLLWWPIDAIVYHRLPQHLAPTAIWRVMVSVVSLLYLLLRRLPPFRAHEVPLFVALCLVDCATMGYTAGLLGGPDRPQFHLLYVLAFATVPLPLRLRSRFAMTLLISGSICAGCFLPFAEHRRSLYLPLSASFSLCVALLSVTFGHMLFLLLRNNFFQAAELAVNNVLLEQRVAERTQDLRTLLSRLETAREEERSRIARELHDELGQELTAQQLTLAIAEECLDGELGLARQKLAELRALLDQTMSTVRHLLADLRPRILDDLGLGAAAEWLAKRTEARTGLRCRLSLSGDLAALDRPRSTAAFRILQESLTNVTRHAHATEVAIEISATAQALRFRVRDDGIGLTQNPGQRGFGILGMRERAQALSGTLELRTLPEGGTEVTCELPATPARGGHP